MPAPKLRLVAAPHKRAICEKEMRYDLMLGDKLVGEAYHDGWGYRIDRKQDQLHGFLSGRHSMTALKREVAHWNKHCNPHCPMRRVTRDEACERSIVLAADSVEKLRSQDVARVMDDYFFAHGSTSDLVDYISEHRPDLRDEAMACRLDLAPNNQAQAQPPGPDQRKETQ